MQKCGSEIIGGVHLRYCNKCLKLGGLERIKVHCLQYGTKRFKTTFQEAQLFLDSSFLFNTVPGSVLTQWKELEENIRLHALKPFYKGAGPTREGMAHVTKSSRKAITILEKTYFLNSL